MRKSFFVFKGDFNSRHRWIEDIPWVVNGDNMEFAYDSKGYRFLFFFSFLIRYAVRKYIHWSFLYPFKWSLCLRAVETSQRKISTWYRYTRSKLKSRRKKKKSLSEIRFISKRSENGIRSPEAKHSEERRPSRETLIRKELWKPAWSPIQWFCIVFAELQFLRWKNETESENRVQNFSWD